MNPHYGGMEPVDMLRKPSLVAEPTVAAKKFARDTDGHLGTTARAREGRRHRRGGYKEVWVRGRWSGPSGYAK